MATFESQPDAMTEERLKYLRDRTSGYRGAGLTPLTECVAEIDRLRAEVARLRSEQPWRGVFYWGPS